MLHLGRGWPVMAGSKREQSPAQRHSACMRLKRSDVYVHGCHRGFGRKGKSSFQGWDYWHNLLSFNGFRAEKVLDTNQPITYFGML